MRKAKVSEYQMCLEWLRANREGNHFDEDVPDYPTTEMVIANENSVAPVHFVVVLDSLGFKPGLDVQDKLEGAVQLVAAAENRAKANGCKEIHFIHSHEGTSEFAAKHLGFEKVTVYRKKL